MKVGSWRPHPAAHVELETSGSGKAFCRAATCKRMSKREVAPQQTQRPRRRNAEIPTTAPQTLCGCGRLAAPADPGRGLPYARATGTGAFRAVRRTEVIPPG